jgi:serine/threonine protein phosphatase 1
MRYAITDIHGCSRTFKTLLDRINLRHKDVLFLLGDYVDRGPDSMGVLETISHLLNAGYDVRPLRGNHDEMLLRTVLCGNDSFSKIYLDELGLNSSQISGASEPNTFPSQYIKLLESMPYIYVETDYVFVHAGLNMNADDPINDSDIIEMLWSRGDLIDSRKLGGRQLVTGHTIEPLDVIKDSVCTGHICLDNGAFTKRLPEMGNLVALSLETKELIIQPWCDGELG